MSTETQEQTVVKKGRRPNPPTPSIGAGFLLLRVFINDKKHLQDESVEDRKLKSAKKRVIELYTENKDWARIDAIVQKLDGDERVLFSMCYLDAFPFFIDTKAIDGVEKTYRFSARKDAQKAYKELDQHYGGVVATNAFDRTVKSN